MIFFGFLIFTCHQYILIKVPLKSIKFMTELLSMGPPVYWVLGTKLLLNETSNQNLICGGEGCNNDSIISELYTVSKYPEM